MSAAAHTRSVARTSLAFVLTAVVGAASAVAVLFSGGHGAKSVASASWNTVKPASASWNTVKPASASWNTVKPASASWNTVKPASASWNGVSTSSASWN